MDEEPQGHGHKVSMDLPDGKGRREAMIVSGSLGLLVAVITFGICGWMQRKTFRDIDVTFEDASRVTVIGEEK